MQQNSAHFEEGIVRSIQSAWQTFDEWQSRMSGSVQDTWRGLGQGMASLAPDREWISFSARSDHLLDPETPLRNPEYILYPSKEDPSVVPVHTGMMERKKRYTRSYRESYFVLTPAGFLHEYASSDPASSGGHSPLFSLFLPACTLGPASSMSAQSHKFHIEERKDGQGSTKMGSLKGTFGGLGSGHAWSFRARSHEDMMEWWNDVRMLCARYLVASEQMERSGPVHAAVRSAGYVSEEEEEMSEEGSSVEEEEDEEEEEEEEDMYQDAVVDEEGDVPPSYSHPAKAGALEMGQNGYPVCLSHFLLPASLRNILTLHTRRSRRNLTLSPRIPTTTPHSSTRTLTLASPAARPSGSRRRRQKDVCHTSVLMMQVRVLPPRAQNREGYIQLREMRGLRLWKASSKRNWREWVARLADSVHFIFSLTYFLKRL